MFYNVKIYFTIDLCKRNSVCIDAFDTSVLPIRESEASDLYSPEEAQRTIPCVI